MKLAKTSIALLVIQLAIGLSVAAKYFYQRSTCPRVWTRAAAYDPELVMRGRYLSLAAHGRRMREHSALREASPVPAHN